MRIIVIFLIYAWLLCFSQPSLALAGDVLNAGEKIITGSQSILVSAGQKFALGFFIPPSGTSTNNYIGIWYYQSEDSSNPQTVVWVANRDNPVDSSGAFHIAEDGNLVITDATGKSFWSSNLESSSSTTNRTAILMDNGNLVLLENHLGGSSSYRWQSFQHPTDTFLPGMKMDSITNLTSWKDPSEPGPGNFTFEMASEGDNRYVIFDNNQNQLHWESEKSGEMNSDAAFGRIVYLLTNFTLNTNPESSRSRYKINGTHPQDNYNYTRLLMNSTGELQFLRWDNILGGSSVLWKARATASFCETYNACGTFSSCNSNNYVSCKCLPGFINKGRNSGQEQGCFRKSVTCGEDIMFLTLVMVKMGNPDRNYPSKSEKECQSMCRNMCPQCQAYSYIAPKTGTTRGNSDSNCWIWTRDLNTLQEEYHDNSGRNLSLLVHKSDIEPTPKTCEPCSTIEVPYPLSTKPTCGEPMYGHFSCDYTTGQLSFKNNNYSYRVTNIDPGSRKFTIKADDYCYKKYLAGGIDFPFPFNEAECLGEENDARVTWQPPSEPICNESEDCVGWNHSSCKLTTNRCLCDTNYRWDNTSLSCMKETTSLANPLSEEPKPNGEGNSKSSLPLILGITLTSAVVLACAIVFGYVLKRKQKDSESIQRNRLRFYDSERHVKDLIDVSELEERDNEGIEVPFYDFESILLATNNFSDENKLGRGGYGPVYKGKLQGGEVIAVKRLSSVSSQGLKEFKNEVVLIAKLQHRNLVRLRGYCIKGEEKILLYEYMPNGSLDLVIFDSTRSALLDWQMRFDIIVGIARGLLYLHQDSRLRVIHRDLKTSNILLDEEMQPKISDFGLARIVGSKETEANTERVVGTYGYMSPEYALDGLFSTKSDIFSFGVVLLEIISGKKNTGFYDKSKQISSLLGYAWRLYSENKLLDLMDMSLAETCNVHQFTKCAQIGLLCVQDEPGDRPTMSNVVTMLDSETATLPTPKQPTFFSSRGQSSTASSSKPEASLHFESSYQEGR